MIRYRVIGGDVNPSNKSHITVEIMDNGEDVIARGGGATIAEAAGWALRQMERLTRETRERLVSDGLLPE